jgi:hypothetical protein
MHVRTGIEQINLKSNSIDKYSYLSNLRNSNVNLFYRLLIDYMKVCLGTLGSTEGRH